MPSPGARESRPSRPRRRFQRLSAISARAHKTLSPRVRLTIVRAKAARSSELDEVALQHLAGGVARELVEEGDRARHLVAREIRTDVFLDVLLGQLGTIAHHQKHGESLPELLIGHTH